MSTNDDQAVDQIENVPETFDLVATVEHVDGIVWTEPPIVRIDSTHAVFRRGAPARVFVNDIYAGNIVGAGPFEAAISQFRFGPFDTKAETVAYLVRMLRASLGKHIPGVPR